MASVLAFDGSIGSRWEVIDGVYTGAPGGPIAYGKAKASLIAELAAAEGISLAGSFAYSDSASDLPMLRAVEFPVAVNPDAELIGIAAAEGWPVLRVTRRFRWGLAGRARHGPHPLAAGHQHLARLAPDVVR